MLTPEKILGIYEACQGQRESDQALIILHHALPDATPDNLADLPLGQRDGLLMQVHRTLFGSSPKVPAVCPACGDQFEAVVAIDKLLPEDWAPGGPSTFNLTVGPLQIEARPNCTRDLDAIPPDQIFWPETRRKLIEAAVLKVLDGAREVPKDSLDDAAIDAIGDARTSADPLADIWLQLECEMCAASWEWPFRITEVLWTELARTANRLFDEVHELAHGYGWTQADILSLSPVRRAAYLARLRA
jgi:hypothetical protein